MFLIDKLLVGFRPTKEITMSSDIMFNVALKFDFHPIYDQEYLIIEEQISIKLEMFLIDKLLVGFRKTEKTMVDFEAELKFIADWLEEPKNTQNVDYVECIRFANGEEIMLQNTTDCKRAWMTITNFAEFVEPEGRSRTTQSNTRMHYTSMCEEFNLSN